ncbi:MAG: SusC/RagA family TonB-linked outer membrane protein [Tannerellaceae bacterium]|jgi:TonB-linked SusC/RagA family outer membrane protein|nr:SusC/RagA family TonB-linked outer membrane protein [Tannerellaceae bacterium]
MKLTLTALFICITGLFATESNSQTARVNISMRNVNTGDIIEEIERQTDYLFLYASDEINPGKKVSVEADNQTVAEVLSGLFKDTNIIYALEGTSIFLMKKEDPVAHTQPQQTKRTIRGKVTDERNEPIIGANTVEKGTINGTITDYNGEFSLNVSPDATITVSYIGYKNTDIAVGNETYYTIRLKEDLEILDEVVVTALGIRREEKALGYAVQKISGESLTSAKGVDLSGMLTGQIAGLNVLNTTEFNENNEIKLRGENTLLIIDGIPSENMSLSNIASDDIESIDVLKGPTATALYGAMGKNGAIMITTKKGGKNEGLDISVNSNTMFFAGYLAFPEAQSSYSYGFGGKYDDVSGYVWGDKLDIGRSAIMWDPHSYEKREQELISKGKDNFRNFLEFSMVTNNNVSVSQKGKYGSFRTSLTHIYNKGQYPNQKLNSFNYYVGGEMNLGNFKLDAAAGINKRVSPNDFGAGYYSSSYIYDMVVWGGTEYDIRDYKNNYWIRGQENIQQNWYDKSWYDNPYFKAYEVLKPTDKTTMNAYLNGSYQVNSWLKAMLRAGMDTYINQEENRNAISANYSWDKKGYFSTSASTGYSINSDAMLMADKTWGMFNLNILGGANLYYWKSNNQYIRTAGGITIPGFYSIHASVNPVQTPYSFDGNSNVMKQKQVNSLYGKLSLSWASTYFIDITGRNDWSSTLTTENRSYFYPSVAGSVVLSEIVRLPAFWDFWKIRGSWTMTKQDANVYANNNVYAVEANKWNGLGTASFPNTIIGNNISPKKAETIEAGTGVNFFKNRLYADFAYFRKVDSDFIINGGVSQATGFSSIQTNSEEELLRRGFELTVGGTPVKTSDFQWDILTNWARDVYTYKKLDPDHSTNKPWIYEGARWDWFELYDWERDTEGNIVHNGGMPVQQSFVSKRGNTRPDLIWGITNSLRYKQFTLSFSFDGRVGGMSFSRTVQTMLSSGSHIDTDTQWRYDEVVDGKINYIAPGVKIVSGEVKRDAEGNILEDTRQFAPNDVPVSYQAYILRFNDGASRPKWQNVFDETFVKLRNLSVTYHLPADITNKLRLKDASIGLTGQNLLLWTKEYKMSDPDKGGDSYGYENLSSPSQRYLGVNFRFNF